MCVYVCMSMCVIIIKEKEVMNLKKSKGATQGYTGLRRVQGLPKRDKSRIWGC
jgi:hypothetical protein